MDATVTKALRTETDALFALEVAIGDEAHGGVPGRELSTGPFVDALVAAVASRVRAELAAKVRELARYDCENASSFSDDGSTYATMDPDKTGDWLMWADVLALLEPAP